MAESLSTAEELHPSNPQLQQATKEALTNQIPESGVQAFLDKVGSAATAAPLGATLDLEQDRLLVEPDGQPWKYDCPDWGGSGYADRSVGFMYTSYDSWDAFFQNVTGYVVQGIAVGGGILQINWFISNGSPVGQGNFAYGGIGPMTGGGSCKWQHT
jgi:hypothetical protein